MKRVFISGSTRGIGFSLAKRFLSSGKYIVTVHGRERRGIDDLAILFGLTNLGNVEYLAMDLNNLDDVESFNTEDYYDIFINNAGIYSSDSTGKLINVNLTSSIILTEKFYESMKHQGGTIININSLAGIFPNFKERSYCATKYGLDGFFKSLQAESFKDNIDVIQYYLGATSTDMTRHREDWQKLIDPEEIADKIYSDLSLSSFIPISQVIKRKKY